MFVLMSVCVAHMGAEQGHIRVINKNTISLFFFFIVNRSSSSFLLF